MLLAKGRYCAISPYSLSFYPWDAENPQQAAFTAPDGSSGVLIMLVSVAVPDEKLPGQKGVTKKIIKIKIMMIILLAISTPF